ncbi:MAG: hypothetical protein AABX01_07370 [Candidatus Micrarchaeota archaeon]|mgnify:CR=1 FL=1
MAKILPLLLFAFILLGIGCVKNNPSPTLAASQTPTSSIAPINENDLPCAQRDLAMRDSCYLQDAQDLKNANGCNKIQNAKIASECFAYIAKYSKIYDICEGIPFDYPKFECITEVAVAKEDAAICYKIPETNAKNACLAKFADPSRDASKCEAIIPAAKKNSCLLEMALRLSQPTVCSRMEGQIDRDRCRQDIAIRMNYLSICDEIENADRTSNCYIRIATLRNDTSICEGIQEPPEGKSLCYSNMANATNNSALCAKVPIETYRGYCYGMFVTGYEEKICASYSQEYNPNTGCQRIMKSKFNPEKCTSDIGVPETVPGGYCWVCRIKCAA